RVLVAMPQSVLRHSGEVCRSQRVHRVAHEVARWHAASALGEHQGTAAPAPDQELAWASDAAAGAALLVQRVVEVADDPSLRLQRRTLDWRGSNAPQHGSGAHST